MSEVKEAHSRRWLHTDSNCLCFTEEESLFLILLILNTKGTSNEEVEKTQRRDERKDIRSTYILASKEVVRLFVCCSESNVPGKKKLKGRGGKKRKSKTLVRDHLFAMRVVKLAYKTSTPQLEKTTKLHSLSWE